MTKIENLLEEAVLGHLEVAPEEGEHLVLFSLLSSSMWMFRLIFKLSVDFLVDF